MAGIASYFSEKNLRKPSRLHWVTGKIQSCWVRMLQQLTLTQYHILRIHMTEESVSTNLQLLSWDFQRHSTENRCTAIGIFYLYYYEIWWIRHHALMMFSFYEFGPVKVFFFLSNSLLAFISPCVVKNSSIHFSYGLYSTIWLTHCPESASDWLIMPSWWLHDLEAFGLDSQVVNMRKVVFRNTLITHSVSSFLMIKYY